MDARRGLEPRLLEPKSSVLPLDERAEMTKIYQLLSALLTVRFSVRVPR